MFVVLPTLNVSPACGRAHVRMDLGTLDKMCNRSQNGTPRVCGLAVFFRKAHPECRASGRLGLQSVKQCYKIRLCPLVKAFAKRVFHVVPGGVLILKNTA